MLARVARRRLSAPLLLLLAGAAASGCLEGSGPGLRCDMETTCHVTWGTLRADALYGADLNVTLANHGLGSAGLSPAPGIRYHGEKADCYDGRTNANGLHPDGRHRLVACVQQLASPDAEGLNGPHSVLHVSIFRSGGALEDEDIAHGWSGLDARAQEFTPALEAILDAIEATAGARPYEERPIHVSSGSGAPMPTHAHAHVPE